MGITITCFDPATGTTTTFDGNSVSSFGGGVTGSETSGGSLFGAVRLNLSIMDAQETIAQGRAMGIRPFNIYNSASPWESAQ